MQTARLGKIFDTSHQNGPRCGRCVGVKSRAQSPTQRHDAVSALGREAHRLAPLQSRMIFPPRAHTSPRRAAGVVGVCPLCRGVMGLAGVSSGTGLTPISETGGLGMWRRSANGAEVVTPFMAGVGAAGTQQQSSDAPLSPSSYYPPGQTQTLSSAGLSGMYRSLRMRNGVTHQKSGCARRHVGCHLQPDGHVRARLLAATRLGEDGRAGRVRRHGGVRALWPRRHIARERQRAPGQGLELKLYRPRPREHLVARGICKLMTGT
ncbi:hypothetical protein C8J57DRAFT_1612615 [Mycena rebaudengoi]|nr:hypothetical protein C8J57DRAFT_1612615 [Mycena rebaudengoi]